MLANHDGPSRASIVAMLALQHCSRHRRYGSGVELKGKCVLLQHCGCRLGPGFRLPGGKTTRAPRYKPQRTPRHSSPGLCRRGYEWYYCIADSPFSLRITILSSSSWRKAWSFGHGGMSLACTTASGGGGSNLAHSSVGF